MSAAVSPGKLRGTEGFLVARCESNGTWRECRLLNLSQRSAFVESFVPLTTGAEVTLEFSLPNGQPVSASGIVKYHQFKIGFGVEFNNLFHPDREESRDRND